MARQASVLINSLPSDDILIHAHDWLTAFASKSLKHRYHIPLIATIHATEHGRNHGIYTGIQRYINSIEWELSYESWRIICCSQFIKDEVMYVLGTPSDKIDVIPNGVDVSRFDFPFPESERQEFRGCYAAPYEKIVFTIGRLVHAKGLHVLVEAIPRVLARYPQVRFIIAGHGERDPLILRARELGIADRVSFTGFIDNETRLRLYRVADCAAFPSLYEPFGIVALEAMASHLPVVVSDAGGFREIVQHDVTGITTWADNPDSLTWGILEILENPQEAHRMAERAYQEVLDRFQWNSIAKETIRVYQRVLSEYEATGWSKERSKVV